MYKIHFEIKTFILFYKSFKGNANIIDIDSVDVYGGAVDFPIDEHCEVLIANRTIHFVIYNRVYFLHKPMFRTFYSLRLTKVASCSSFEFKLKI